MMRERPTLAQIAGIVLLAWLASLLLGPLGAAIAGPSSSGAGHIVAISGYLLSGAVLILAVLALVGATWRFRLGLLSTPATRSKPHEDASGVESAESEDDFPDDEEDSGGFTGRAPDESRPATDWGFGETQERDPGQEESQSPEDQDADPGSDQHWGPNGSTSPGPIDWDAGEFTGGGGDWDDNDRR
jgi:hypothetical protein